MGQKDLLRIYLNQTAHKSQGRRFWGGCLKYKRNCWTEHKKWRVNKTLDIRARERIQFAGDSRVGMDDGRARLPASCAISVRKRRKSWIYLSERANQKQEPEGRVYRIQSDGSGFDICSTSPQWRENSVVQHPNQEVKVFFFWARQIFYHELVWTKPSFGKGPKIRRGSRGSVAYQAVQKNCLFSTNFHWSTLPLWLFTSVLSSTGFSTTRYRDKTPQTVFDEWFNWDRPFPSPLLGPTPLSVSDISTPDTFGGGVVVGSKCKN